MSRDIDNEQRIGQEAVVTDVLFESARRKVAQRGFLPQGTLADTVRHAQALFSGGKPAAHEISLGDVTLTHFGNRSDRRTSVRWSNEGVDEGIDLTITHAGDRRVPRIERVIGGNTEEISQIDPILGEVILDRVEKAVIGNLPRVGQARATAWRTGLRRHNH